MILGVVTGRRLPEQLFPAGTRGSRKPGLFKAQHTAGQLLQGDAVGGVLEVPRNRCSLSRSASSARFRSVISRPSRFT